MKLWIKLIICAFALLAGISFANPILATEQPTSTPTAEFYVYRNLLETGDWLLLIYDNIPYSTIPDETTGQTFLWRMIDTDDSTELGSTAPYAFNDNGFGYTIASMYWSAAEVTALGMVWGTNYTMRLFENPAYFSSPVFYDYTISTSDYSILTVPADVKDELATRILIIGGELDSHWGLGATYSLLNETETGTVLSVYGEAFFRGAIYGLQGLCPEIFAYIIQNLDLTPRTWSSAYESTLENQYSGTWSDSAKAAGAALFGTSYDLTALIVTLLAAAVLAVCTVILSGDAWHGLADARTVLIVSSRLGFLGLGFLALLAALAVIYGASRMWGVMK